MLKSGPQLRNSDGFGKYDLIKELKHQVDVTLTLIESESL